MNKKALIALVVVVITALGGGLYYKNYAEKNAMPPNLQATGLYQGSTADKQTGFLKAEKAKVGAEFKQTKKDADGKESTAKANLKFVPQAGGLSDVYSETDTNLGEITGNFKASAERQEYMAGFYNVGDGKWKTTKQTYYGFDGISVITDTAALAHTSVPANNTFVFVSNKDSELYGYKDSSVEPSESSNFCLEAKDGWNSGVVKSDELYSSVSHCMSSIVSVWVKVANYPLDAKFKKIYTDGGTEDALKAYKMKDFYMVWVKFDKDESVSTSPETEVADTGKLEVKGLQVIGSAVNADKTVSIDPTKELMFRWGSTYDGDTIAQYEKNDRTDETVSYTWTLKDSAGKGLWELTQAYGKGTQGVSKDDATCFLQLFNAGGEELDSGKDWVCEYTSTPGDIALVADTKYTFTVTAHDGTDKTIYTWVDFTTEKAGVVETNKKLEVKDVEVKGTGVNADKTVNPTKDLRFTWTSTYDSTTIAQYKDTKKAEPALSHELKLTDPKTSQVVWALAQAWGTGTQGVTSEDAKCFNQLYDASGKELASGKDWICKDFVVPSYIKEKLLADTKYTFEVTALDGTGKTVKSSLDFITEKAIQKSSALKVDVKLNTDSAKAQEIKQGTSDISLAKFDISTNIDITTKSITLDYTGVSGAKGASDIKTIYILNGAKELASSSAPKFPLKIDISTTVSKDNPATIEVIVEMVATAYTGADSNKHAIKLIEIELSDGTKITPNVVGNTMTIIQKDVEIQQSTQVDKTTAKLSADAAIGNVISPGTEVQFASFEFIPKADVSIKSVIFEKRGFGALSDFNSISMNVNGGAFIKKDKPTQNPIQFDFSEAIKLNKDVTAKIAVKAEISATAQAWNTHFLKLKEIVFSDNSKLVLDLDSNTMTIVADQNTKFSVSDVGVKDIKATYIWDSASYVSTVDLNKAVTFTWESTYDSTTIAQYEDDKKAKPTLSYELKLTNVAKKEVTWELSQAWGKGTQGVTAEDVTCFKQLYGVEGKALVSGKDWICKSFIVPDYIKTKLEKGAEYTFEVTAFDGKETKVTDTKIKISESFNAGGTNVFNILDIILDLFR